MKPFRSLILAAAALVSSLSTADADQKVLASVKPIHSLVAGVMMGVGDPEIIVDGAGSPHAYSLKPSQARNLQQADIIFWVGHELEAFLEKPIETLGARARVVELMDADGLTTLSFREGGPFDDHGHDGGHGKTNATEPGHDDHGAVDVHLWLDPQNAKAMVGVIGKALIVADPASGAKYQANAQALRLRLDDLTAEIEATLAPVKGRSFIVFHDGFQYFENRFGVKAAGSITVSPESIPGAERVSEIQARVKELGATCVFAEPQFKPKLVSVVIEGTNAKSAVLDPLGASIENGPELYFTLMRNMAGSIRDCLSEGS